MNKPTPRQQVNLREHMVATYKTLRYTLFAIGVLLPLVLWFGGYILGSILEGHRLELQGSMSAYYHANRFSDDEFAKRETERLERVKAGFTADVEIPKDRRLAPGRGVMRNWFVGSLFIIGAMLFAYKGYRPAEDRALNLAGLFAVLVALFPMPWDLPKPTHPTIWDHVTVHGVCAFLFFGCIAYVCNRCASATLVLIPNHARRARYRRRYKWISYVMLASPIAAFVLTQSLGFRSSFLFFAEAFGVWAFAMYWLWKGFEISETGADRKAAMGELKLPRGGGLSDAAKEFSVIPADMQDGGVTEPGAPKP
jgi:hypothetical protein